MMKRLLIITVLIFGVLVAFGQKNVSDKEKEAAPKTALIEAQKDYQKAVKEKNNKYNNYNNNFSTGTSNTLNKMKKKY